MSQVFRPHRLVTLLWATSGLLLIVTPVAMLALLWAARSDPTFLVASLPRGVTPGTVTAGAITLAWAAALPGVLAGMYVLAQMRGLFTRYRRGEVFSPACARHIRRVGIGMALACLATIAGQTGAVAALSWGNPPGERMVSIALSSWQIAALLGAGFVTIIGHVMTEAARLADENAGFV